MLIGLLTDDTGVLGLISKEDGFQGQGLGVGLVVGLAGARASPVFLEQVSSETVSVLSENQQVKMYLPCV